VTIVENFALGPLPVINAVCEEFELVKVIDEIVDWDETQAEISPKGTERNLWKIYECARGYD
jgi:hypothetical protein